MQTIISKIKERAKKEKKKIVLPESEDVRVLKAASIASLENIAEIILIGDKNKIKEICIKENIDLSIDEHVKNETNINVVSHDIIFNVICPNCDK